MAQRVRQDGPYPLLTQSSVKVKEWVNSGFMIEGSSESHVNPGFVNLFRKIEDTKTADYSDRMRRNLPLPVNAKTTIAEHGQLTAGDIGFTVKHEYDPSQSYAGFIQGTFAEWTAARAWGFMPQFSLDQLPVITDARAKLSSAGWDAGTSLAELHKTIGLVAGAKKRFVKILQRIVADAKKRNFDGTLSVMQSINNLWLEARYGWRPLAYELRDIGEALSELSDYTSSALKRYGSYDSKREEVDGVYADYSLLTSSGLSSSVLEKRVSYRLSRLVEVRAGIGANSRISDVAFVDPFITAWELVPFSFVVNWFVNVDAWIANLTPRVERNVAFAWATTRITESMQIDSVCAPYPLGFPFQFGLSRNAPSTLTYEKVTAVRTPVAVNFSLGFNIKMTTLNHVDFWSLVSQILAPLARTTPKRKK